MYYVIVFNAVGRLFEIRGKKASRGFIPVLILLSQCFPRVFLDLLIPTTKQLLLYR